MKTCVFITGTNCCGKSTLAFKLIEKYGGVDRITNDVTYCREGSVSLAGKYGVTKYGGVDRITNDKGHSCTSRLAEVVAEALKNTDIVYCEGMYLHTFGLNLTNAMFQADRHLLVFLYAPVAVIHQRLVERSGKGITNKAVISKMHNAAAAARKWSSIGVPVLTFDTSKISVEEEVEIITAKVAELCG